MSGPQGKRCAISAGGYSAEIAVVGASLASLRGPRGHLVRSTPPEGLRPGCSGAILAPWPNRIQDGRYEFAGTSHHLPLTEPERNNAAHGLVLWERWEILSHTAAEVILGLDLVPQPGYPFELRLKAVYSLTSNGLEWRVSATNLGDQSVPYAVAGHPYLVADGSDGQKSGALNDWSLKVPASVYIDADMDRLLPLGTYPVDNTHFDFRSGRRLDDFSYDVALGGLGRNEDGRTACELTSPNGGGVVLECGPEVNWIQVYTDDQATGEPGRRAVAVEPMTAPADAFRSGQDLTVIEPGQTHSAWWRLAALSDV
ncbi:aldose 1-epimerase family protein [Kocuria sp. TGY1127_2]|uniref:aldose 1-epimerase family protein n=1 Tax=Kocuria sp. TGY1127_2 TaxID=2711328 RepID=UPI0015BE55C7|nr:aldose 1-epimerase family protein [Kocuria sp. TGY1127_2]